MLNFGHYGHFNWYMNKILTFFFSFILYFLISLVEYETGICLFDLILLLWEIKAIWVIYLILLFLFLDLIFEIWNLILFNSTRDSSLINETLQTSLLCSGDVKICLTWFEILSSSYSFFFFFFFLMMMMMKCDALTNQRVTSMSWQILLTYTPFLSSYKICKTSTGGLK